MARFSMLDIALIRRDPDRVRESLLRRGLDASPVDDLLRYDEEYRLALTAVERAKAEKNRLTATIAEASDRAAAARELRPQLEEVSRRIDALEQAARALSPSDESSPLRALLDVMPNLLDASVPDGADETANLELRRWGEPRHFDFVPKPNWELGENLRILDFSRAAKLSGSRFVVLAGAGARLSRALTAFFLDRALDRGYLEIAPPLLVSRETMWSTGQLSKFADAMFADPQADLFMIPTSEVPLTALRGGEILESSGLPQRYVAATPCFRKEAGAAGKDTRGLMRLHQFDKVELVWLTAPESSFDALETLTGHAESLLQELDLPYRVVALCAGDTGFNAAKSYDVEVWIPSSNTYREISSCSNCTDFQARRASVRFRRDATSKPEFVHTLNGSGLAIGRTMIALLENHQQSDGSIVIPPALRPYTGFDRISN
ncbi:MAG TPA: serine--tRNA ligase [Candidatus Acidoferrales bacterium]|jgi:seryl-tRNA synthetase|nr:serine--tRNA ligase [Candidatus Acidoferrales bacterium]